MIIALVLLTLDTMPEPEESLVSESTVHTPVTFHYSHRDLPPARRNSPQSICQNAVPTLVETLCHYVRTHPEQVNFRHHPNCTIVIFRPKRSAVLLLAESTPEVLTFPDKNRVIGAVRELLDVSAIALVEQSFAEHQRGQGSVDESLWGIAGQCARRHGRKKSIGKEMHTRIAFDFTCIGWVKVDEMPVPSQCRESE